MNALELNVSSSSRVGGLVHLQNAFIGVFLQQHFGFVMVHCRLLGGRPATGSLLLVSELSRLSIDSKSM